MHQEAPDFSRQKPGTRVTTSGWWKEPGEVVINFGVLNKCINRAGFVVGQHGTLVYNGVGHLT